MIALFDRLSSPFSENRIERIRVKVDIVFEEYFSEYPARFTAIEKELKALDNEFLLDSEEGLSLMIHLLTKGIRQFSEFRTTLNLSLVKTIRQMNNADPVDSFFNLIFDIFGKDFLKEYSDCDLFQQSLRQTITSEILSGNRLKLAGEIFNNVYTVIADYLELLDSTVVRKLIVSEISRAFDDENNYKNRLIESVTDELQRIVSTKVYLDTDSSRKTIMNYGVAGIVNFSAGNAKHYDRICHELKTSVEAFESRLINPRVFLIKDKNVEAQVKCIIEGQIAGDESHEVLKFPMTL